jgi:uncharacterized phage protein (TIGR02218 family)
MKTIPAALQAHYDTGNTCLAYAIVIQREDGALYGFTSHDQSFSMDVSPWGYGSSELAFNAEQGFSASDIVSTAGFEVDNLELTTLDDGTLFDRDEVLAGAWTNAEFRIFRYRWDVSPVTIADDVETLIRGWFGEVTLNQNTFRIELRGLAQKLQQPVGIVSTKTCRARLGDSACKKDLTSFTHTLTVTGVTDKRTFTASGATQDPDYFGEGIVTWLTGDNAAGRAHKIRTFEAGVFTLSLPTVLPIQVGDTFTAVAGCRKRLMEDCKVKFNNVLNFQGEPHRPTVDTLTKAP